MRLDNRHWGLIALCALLVGSLSAQERMTVWVTFDNQKVGPAVACDGEFHAGDGGRIEAQEWMHDDRDTIEGTAFSLATEHDATTAEAARLRVARRPLLPKGLILSVDAPPGATLGAVTRIGNFDVPLGKIRTDRSVYVLDGKVRLERIPDVAAMTGDQAEEEYASVTTMPDGRVALACVAWDGKSDQVLLRIGNETQTIAAPRGDYMDPRCAVDGEGSLWMVWAVGDGEQWDLWSWSRGQTNKLTTGARNDFWPRLTRDARGGLWLAWQTVAEDLHYEVMLARLGPNGLSTPVNVSEHPADDWEPALCATPDGRIAVAWDSYRNGSYDVYLREFAPQPDGGAKALGPPRPIAAGPQREAHVTVASDSKSRLWLAWDVGVEDWGKHPKKASSLHSYRYTDVACLAEGKLCRPGADMMKSLPPAFGKFVEYPQIAVDGRDRVWVVFRLEDEIRVFHKTVERAQNYGMWHLFAIQCDGDRWAEPVLLARSNGRQDVRVDVAMDRSGEPMVAYAADGRTRRLPYVPVDYDVFLASLSGFGLPPRDPQLTPADDLGQIAPVPSDQELGPLPREWRVGGKAYRLVIGDTHRHTDISRCSNGYDGSLQDAYRYALDASGLDWLAISDHDQDILKHRADRKPRPRQDYDWWRSQKYCDVYTIPGRFVALYGYEHGGGYADRGGHKNVVSAQRGLPVQEVDAPHELFAALAGSGAIAVPHQLADGSSRTDWAKWNPEFERVGEIFQARGSYEFEDCPRAAKIFTKGFSMWDALAKGVRIGIIASSDHGQTHQARAGVYVEDLPVSSVNGASPTGFTRRGLLAALRARRAFGATVAVAMQVCIGDHPLGEEISIATPPKIQAKLAAPANIARIEIVRDGRFVYTTEPGAAQAALEFTDMDLAPGRSAYYYVRARIGDNDYAWSSPLWVTRAP